MEGTRSWFELITVIYGRVDKLESRVTGVALFHHRETFNQTLLMCLHDFNTGGPVNVTFVPA